jgi:MFS family permease
MKDTSDFSNRRARYLSVVAGTAIALSCGTNYAFSAWEPQFAERLDLTATQANLIGNFGNIGMYAMGIPGGMLIDSRGPRWGVFIGVIGLSVGYFPLHRAYDQGAGSMSVPALCFFSLMTGIASCTAFSAALKVCATNWPNNRGTATAFPLSAFGLSAFFWTTLSAFLFGEDTSAYLLLLAIGATALVAIGMVFLKIMPVTSSYEVLPGGESDSNRLRRTSSHSRHSSKASTGAETGKENCVGDATDNANGVYPGGADERASLVSSDGSVPGDIENVKDRSNVHRKPDISGFVILKTLKFWQLWICLGLLCGVGLMTINNIGNDARALWFHYDDSVSHDFIQGRQLMHVGILSLGSFTGRLCSGIGSDWLIHRGHSRFWTLVASASIFTVAQILAMLIENPNFLFLLSSLTGLGYGALFGVYPALVADAFGTSGMAINWGAMTLAPVVTGNVFNLLYGSILDAHSVKRPGGEHGNELICDEGKACYSSAYWITLFASIVGICWSLWCIRTEKVEKARDDREAQMREHEG